MSASPLPGRIIPGVSAVAAFVLLAGLFGLQLDAAGAVPQVSISNRQEVLFKLVLPAPAWQEAPPRADGQRTWEAVLPRFSNQGMPGSQRVPRAGGWLVG